MTATASNGYEQLGREKKARAIAATIWALVPDAERTRTDLGTRLEKMPELHRDALALRSGQKAPSEKTWARVCDVIDEKAEEERQLVGFLDRIEAAS